MKLNYKERSDRLIDLGLLLLWLLLGLTVRFGNLDLKPASSIEIATIGYSLGHGFAAIPLDKVVAVETLLAPLRFDPTIGYAEVFERLTAESTHPPLYFWLTHWWLDLWLKGGELASLWMARSLSAIFGALAIPASFGLGWVAFRSRLTAHLAAVLMAISPYGVYLAQEARHYTLTVLWVIASVTCLVRAVQLIEQRKPLPIWLSCVWILVNALGVATHYFFVLALGAEAIAFTVTWIFNRRRLSFKYWRGLYLAGCGTLAGCLVWLPAARGVSSNEMTTWIQTSFELNDIWQPPVFLIAWLESMVMLLPINLSSKAVVIILVLIVQAIAIWTVPKLIKGWRSQIANSPENTAMPILCSYLASSLLLFCLIIYGTGRNLSLAARYHFVYFPVFILLIAIALANCWRFPSLKSKQAVVVLLIMGLLGSFTTIYNYGFTKSRDCDRLATIIQTASNNPPVIAMSHYTHSQTRELIALAYSFSRLQDKQLANSSAPMPKFLLNRPYVNGIDTGLYNLDHSLATQNKPLDLWAINLAIGESAMNQIRCYKNATVDLPDSGYQDDLYYCQP